MTDERAAELNELRDQYLSDWHDAAHDPLQWITQLESAAADCARHELKRRELEAQVRELTKTLTDWQIRHGILEAAVKVANDERDNAFPAEITPAMTTAFFSEFYKHEKQFDLTACYRAMRKQATEPDEEEKL